ncbi:Interferon kappa [Galemys pyrenaicus]|uniref:Interferon kappa n=1 Tax=Galemys pyrenaicus TaxID=202257 RepID=A0A8J6ACW1_GALPY|nr:Interferon kappa [Galemys pyrenaicus]
MSNLLPEECLQEKRAFALPQEILLHTQSVKRDIKEAFYEISSQAINILSQYIVKSSWEEQHLQQIQNGLDQQLQYLKQCLEEEEENEDMNLEMKKYFNRIVMFLEEKKYSHCAWEIVLTEIGRCFYFFQKSIALHRGK